jgi:hypothetical protein
MAALAAAMPPLNLSAARLRVWGRWWLATSYGAPKPPARGQPKVFVNTAKAANAFDKYLGMRFGRQFDLAFGKSLAAFLGNIPVIRRDSDSLLPPSADCVEVGKGRVVGGIRPQNYDAVYRPDGPRVVYDSKTLNDRASVRKNWQNMINDLATEAATIHTRFPYCVVAFTVVIPRQALDPQQAADITRTLERMGTRDKVLGENHLAESIALVVWDASTGQVDANTPAPGSNIRIETFPDRIVQNYVWRYKGLEPHT